MDLEAGDLVCTAGCGRWIANHLLAEQLPLDALQSNITGKMTFRMKPFAPARCPVCKTPLEDHYAGLHRSLVTFGKCAAHGIWVEGDRLDFEAAFADVIHHHEEECARRAEASREAARVRDEQAERERRALADATARLAGDDTIDRSELARRIVTLELAVAELQRRLAGS
jgi:hypothetical protein